MFRKLFDAPGGKRHRYHPITRECLPRADSQNRTSATESRHGVLNPIDSAFRCEKIKCARTNGCARHSFNSKHSNDRDRAREQSPCTIDNWAADFSETRMERSATYLAPNPATGRRQPTAPPAKKMWLLSACGHRAASDRAFRTVLLVVVSTSSLPETFGGTPTPRQPPWNRSDATSPLSDVEEATMAHYPIGTRAVLDLDIVVAAGAPDS